MNCSEHYAFSVAQSFASTSSVNVPMSGEGGDIARDEANQSARARVIHPFPATHLSSYGNDVQAFRVSSLSEESWQQFWKAFFYLYYMPHKAVAIAQTEEVSNLLVWRSERLNSAHSPPPCQPHGCGET
jgi:hypothetical protein